MLENRYIASDNVAKKRNEAQKHVFFHGLLAYFNL